MNGLMLQPPLIWQHDEDDRLQKVNVMAMTFCWNFQWRFRFFGPIQSEAERTARLFICGEQFSFIGGGGIHFLVT